MPTSPQLLSSWKEIAAFFGKGVRTVQRWESLGLPVHRPGGDRNRIIADVEELRRWAALRQVEKQDYSLRRFHETVARSRQLVLETKALASRMCELLEERRRPASRSLSSDDKSS